MVTHTSLILSAITSPQDTNYRVVAILGGSDQEREVTSINDPMEAIREAYAESLVISTEAFVIRNFLGDEVACFVQGHLIPWAA